MALPVLTPSLILEDAYQEREDLTVPTPEMLAYPEKVLQFGTGGFLRAFTDFFIDEANRVGQFGGRAVMVGSTGSGRANIVNKQGGLYTLQVQGLKKGETIETYRVIGAVSRAISAVQDWDEVLRLAASPELEIVVSNTTEVGITFDEEDAMGNGAPRSFPGKLTAALYERGRAFSYDAGKGLVVLPCELISDNGDALRSIVLQLASLWKLEAGFVDWVNDHVYFCNTLVDRIVPGTPPASVLEDVYATLGYRDELLTTAEVYRLWPIEGEPAALDRIGFARADPGIVLTEDVRPYKERKVRILNGTHTACVPIAFLAGEETVLSMMRNPATSAFVERIMMEEIVPSLDVPGGERFAREVLDRFNNPFLRHRLIDITLQSTSKWKLRLLPSIQQYVEKEGALPHRICAGFAAYLVFMRGVTEKDGTIFGERDGAPYPIRDDQAAFFVEAWREVDVGDRASVDAFVKQVCGHEPFWGDILARIPGFADRVSEFCWLLLHHGAQKVLDSFRV